MSIKRILESSRIIAVITLSNPRQSIPLANALIRGGIKTLEITLRTPQALDAIKALKRQGLACEVGAGTITTVKQLNDSQAAGASFAVSPGIQPDLVSAAEQTNLPFLPAVATPSDILLAKAHELSFLKFFPAHLMGGIKMLNTFQQVFPELQFCPTGGITQSNFSDYLSLPNVISVGGSWVAPRALIEAEKWDEITELARIAVNTLNPTNS